MTLGPLTGTPGGLLYGRVYSVSLQGLGAGGGVWGNENSSQTPLRVTLSVERNVDAKKNANKCTVSLFNLAPASRAAFKKGAAVLVRAGYVGLVGTVFLGVVAKIKHSRSGPDIETQVELCDSDAFANMSVFEKSYDPPVSSIQILQDVAAAMHLNYANSPVQVSQGIVLGIPEQIYTGGFVAHGDCRRTLDRICRPLGLDWSIANAALQIIPKDHYDGRDIQVLNRQSGLLGIPGDGGGFCTMTSLMNPQLVPGRLVSLASADASVNGVYKLRKTTFKGDSHGGEWQVEMEGLPYQGTVTPLPSASGGSLANAAIPLPALAAIPVPA